MARPTGTIATVVTRPRAAHRRAQLSLLVPLMFVLACAKTTMTSVVNPVSRRPELRRVVVVFETRDPGVRRSFEYEFGQRAGIASVDFIPSYTLFPPEQPIGPEGFGRIARENRVDAFLLYTPGEGGVSGQILGRPTEEGCADLIMRQGCNQPLAGATLEMPWSEYTVMLIEPTDMAAFWRASATSEGRDFADSEDLRHSLADQTIERLLADGLISR